MLHLTHGNESYVDSLDRLLSGLARRVISFASPAGDYSPPVAGRTTRNVAPSPARLPTLIVPPCSSHDAAADGQAETGAGRLGGEERREHRIGRRLGDAGTGVGKRDRHKVPGLGRRHPQHSALGHRLEGVAREILEHASQLLGVAPHLADSWIDGQLDPDAPAARLGLVQRNPRLEQLGHADLPSAVGAAAS